MQAHAHTHAPRTHTRRTAQVHEMPCQEAINLASQAIEADVNNQVARAIDLYNLAAAALEQAARTNPAEGAEMLAKAAEYRARMGVLQQKAQMDKMAAMASGREKKEHSPRAVFFFFFPLLLPSFL